MAQPKPKAQGRISPTEALRIMMTRMAAPRGVQRLTEAMHDWKCRIWRDGKLVPRAEVGHLSVLENYHEETGQYQPVIGDDRWHAVRGEYEFDTDEVRALLPRANDRPSEPPADEVPPSARHKPGTKPTDDWPKELAAELIRIAVDDRTALRNIDKLVRKIQKDFDNTNRFLPQDPKRVRAEIVLLLKYIR